MTVHGDWSRRKFIAGVGAGAAALALTGIPAAAVSNVIVTENQKPGTNAWKLGTKAPDTLSEVSGYCRQHSVLPGQSVDVCVGVGSTRSVRAEVYRMGWYGGSGGRLITTKGNVTVSTSPAPTLNSTTGEIVANWSTVFTIATDSSWVSGIYMIKLIDSSNRQSYAQFVVRDNRGADFLYQQPTSTYLAYTATPTGAYGKSLYQYQSTGPNTVLGTPQAVAVNFDRPYERSGAGLFLLFEIDLVQFLEREGYDVSYVTGMDIHQDPAELRRHKVIMSAGHDEYWSQAMFDGWKAARNAGVHVACFGANSAYWRVEFDAGDRRMTCYKGDASDPGPVTTDRFRVLGQPEDQLWGIQYDRLGPTGSETDLVPTSSGHWFWNGTGVSDGVALPTANVGYEIDRRTNPLPAHTEQAILANSPFEGSTAHTSIYRSTSGAWVWASGTVSWAWALGQPGHVHPAIQGATRNLLNRMLADSGTPEPPDPPAGPYAPFASATAFVTQQYQDFLFRSPDTGGLNWWAGQVASNGSNMPDICRQFLYSAEFAPRFNVARLYKACFNRIPDRSGYDYWTSLRTSGVPIDTIAWQFVASQEFALRYGVNNSNTVFVNNVYANVFGRAPDTAGRNYWVGQLNAGMSRTAVLIGFSESPEFISAFQRDVEVIAVYQGLLGRPPSTADVALKGAQLRNGSLTLNGMIGSILDSSEYAARIA